MHRRGWGSRSARGSSQQRSGWVKAACSAVGPSAALSLPPAALGSQGALRAAMDAPSTGLWRGQGWEQSSRPGEQAAAQERAKQGTACSSRCCGGQSFQQHDPAATGNLLWQLGPTAPGKSKRWFGVSFYLFSGVDQTKLSWLRISFGLDSKETPLTTYCVILLFLCFIITNLPNTYIYCDERQSDFMITKYEMPRKCASLVSLLFLQWKYFTMASHQCMFIIISVTAAGQLSATFMSSLSIMSAATGDLLSPIE